MRGKNNLLPRVVSVVLAAVLLVVGLNYSMLTEESGAVNMPLAYSAGGMDTCDHAVELPVITKQATTTEPGEIEYKCVSCGMVLREEIIPVMLKRERPLSVINTEKCTLFNIPENSIVAVNGKVVSFSASGSIDLSAEFAAAGDYVITVIANETELAASDPQSIYVYKPAAPGDVQTLPANGNVNGLISGVGTFMEYKPVNSDTWSICVSETQPLPAGIYQVRIRATAVSIASEPFEVIVGQIGQVSETIPVYNENKEEAKPVEQKNIIKSGNGKKESKKTDDKKETVAPAKEEVKQEEEKKVEPPKIEVDNIFTKGDSEPIAVSGETGFDSIIEKIEKGNSPVVVSLNDSVLIPAEVFVKAAENNVQLVFILKNGATWTINPADIDVDKVSALHKINLGIVDNSNKIPSKVLATIEDVTKGQIFNKTFDIEHNGRFGFIAYLTVKIAGANPGDYANLFSYDTFEGILDYVGSSIINDDNEATFEMSHASSYVIVTSKEEMSQDSVKMLEVETTSAEPVSVAQETVKTTKIASPLMAGLIIILAAIIIAILAIVRIQKRNVIDIFGRKKKK